MIPFKLPLAAAFAALCLAGTATAQELACNSNYITQRGDTLSRIAERAYGNPRGYQRIFDVNPGQLTSINILPIGINLFIPCEDDPSIELVSGELPALREASGNNIKILTGDDYPPYVANDLLNGGFSRELIERALQGPGGATDYRVDVIDDWSSHLTPLLEDGAYDIGFPWFRPDCSQLDRLGEASVWRCENLLFSRPLHELVVSFYGLAGRVDEIRTPEDAYGLTICRPAGYFTFDLEAAGLVYPAVTRAAPDTPQDCFELLANGEVDLVTVNADTADGIITDMGMSSQIVEVIDLSTVQTLHAVGMRTNPRTRLNMRRIDQGLLDIFDSGQFQVIAAQHL